MNFRLTVVIAWRRSRPVENDFCARGKINTRRKLKSSWMAKAFISYKHDAQPDVRIANATFESLMKAGNDVFIDSQILIGDQWPRVIEEKLSAADYLIVFLSEAAIASEMIIEEVAIARRIRKKDGRPKILPVRVAYEDPDASPRSLWISDVGWLHVASRN
jgi:hypothetical protein